MEEERKAHKDEKKRQKVRQMISKIFNLDSNKIKKPTSMHAIAGFVQKKQEMKMEEEAKRKAEAGEDTEEEGRENVTKAVESIVNRNEFFHAVKSAHKPKNGTFVLTSLEKREDIDAEYKFF